MMVLRLLCLGILSVPLLFASVAWGDGCYIPERAVRKIPGIPAQRAVLSWKDGIETLVISSVLDSEAQKLGWIIPLPAVPQTIEKETPGALKTLSFCIQPEITHDRYPAIKAAVIGALIVNLIMGTFLFKRKRFIDVLLLIFFCFIFSSLLLSASAGAGRLTKIANMRVEKSVAVGSYKVEVLRPKKYDDLNAWLVENRFSTLPKAADAIVADYISHGWVFAAIKLTRAESGENAPHPIRMAFPSKQAIYPLKLTSLSGGNTFFEVFVVADDAMSCTVLGEEFCDQFSKEHRDESEPREAGDDCYGKTSHCKIGHSTICSLMWNNCVLTKFAGTINAANMKNDIRFNRVPFKAYRQHFYTPRGARETATILFVCLLGGAVFISMIAFSTRIAKPGGVRWYFGKILLPATILSVIITTMAYVSLPKLSASETVPVRSLYRLRMSAYILRNKIDQILAEQKSILQGTEQEIADQLLRHLAKGQDFHTENTVMGTNLIVEDSPGNFTVEKNGRNVLVRIYDYSGSTLIVERTISNPSGKRAGRGRVEGGGPSEDHRRRAGSFGP